MAARGLFVTGTDTGIGKTVVTCALIRALADAGARVAGMKPVASGVEEIDGRRIQEDVEAIRAAVPGAPDAGAIAPFVLDRPAAPEFAAEDQDIAIDLDTIRTAYARLAGGSDLVVVEGVGGWAVPLGPGLELNHLVGALDLEVVMVVGLKLGCINHARLTARALEADGVRMIGWVSNACDPEYEDAQRTIRRLERDIPAPRLGHLPYIRAAALAAIDADATALGAMARGLLNSPSIEV